MMLFKPILAVIISVACLVAATPQARSQEVYHSSVNHYSFTVPAGWSPMQPQDLQRINSASTMPFETGYRQHGSATTYLLASGMSRPDGDMAQGMDEFRKNAPDAVYDPVNKVVIFHNQVINPAVGAIRGTSACFIGKERVVFLHCYALANDSASFASTFNSIDRSFRFDPGYSDDSRGFSETSWGKSVKDGLLGSLIGVIIGVIAVRRRKSRSGASW